MVVVQIKWCCFFKIIYLTKLWPKITRMPIFEHTFIVYNSAVFGPEGLKDHYLSINDKYKLRCFLLLLAGKRAWPVPPHLPLNPIIEWNFWANHFFEIMFSTFSGDPLCSHGRFLIYTRFFNF